MIVGSVKPFGAFAAKFCGIYAVVGVWTRRLILKGFFVQTIDYDIRYGTRFVFVIRGCLPKTITYGGGGGGKIRKATAACRLNSAAPALPPVVPRRHVVVASVESRDRPLARAPRQRGSSLFSSLAATLLSFQCCCSVRTTVIMLHVTWKRTNKIIILYAALAA